MNIYRLRIKTKGFFVNPITGDQLNGGFLYYLSLVYKEMFELFFEGFENNHPPFLFSSFSPSGYLPINSQFIVYHLLKGLSKDEVKSLKKINYLPIDFFSRIASLTKDDFLQISQEKILIKERLPKVSIKNDTLYNQELISFKGGMADLYFIFEDFNFEDIKDYLDEYLGYFVGKKISAGFSNFSLYDFQKLDNLGEGDYLVNLSPFIPKKDEENFYKPLFYDFFIKYPKLGSFFDRGNPFKKKIILVKEGSVFAKKNKANFNLAGLTLDNVSLSFPEARQLCFTSFYQFSL